VIAEVALASVVLIGPGLLVGSFTRLTQSQRRYALLRAVPKKAHRWKRRAFFGFFVKLIT